MRTKDENKIRIIYQAALKLIAETGIAGLSIAALAKEANIGTGSFYTYFKSKEELLNALFIETRKVHSEKLFADYLPDEPVKPAMKKIFMNYLRYRIDYYEHGVFQDQFIVSPYVTENMEDLRQLSLQLMAPMTEVLERGKRENLIKNVENKYFTMMLRGFVNELALMIRIKGREADPEAAEIDFRLFWDAMKD